MDNTLTIKTTIKRTMKKLLLLLSLLSTFLSFSQAASKVNNGQNTYATGQPRVVLSCDTLPSGLFRLYPKASVNWKFNQIIDKPTTLSGYGITDGLNIASFTWANISGKPSFSVVSTSGSYLDLSNQPVIPTNNSQLTNDSNFITPSSSDILTNKTGNISQWTNNLGYLTSFTEVDPTVPAYSKSLNSFNNIKTSTDLLYKPISYIPSSLEISTSLGYIPYNGTTNPNGFITTIPAQTWASITGKPIFSAVANTGDYNDLLNKPTIPSAQVQTDWDATTGLAVLLNKPTIPTNTNQLINGANFITASSTDVLTNKSGNISQWTNNTGYLTTVPAQTFTSLTGKPTTLAGYGITDAYPLTGNPSNFLTSVPAQSWTSITGKPTFATVATTGNYVDLINKPTIPAAQVQSDWNAVSGLGVILNKPSTINYTAGTGINITSGVITNTAPNQTVTLTAGNNITITGSYPNFTISAYTPSPNTVSRSLNSNFTISSTKQAQVFYAITSSATNPLLVGSSTANAFLEYSTNSGSTWNSVSQVGNSNGVGLAVSVALTNGQTAVLGGNIPANALVRIRTATTGTSSVTFITGQETY